MSREGTTLYCGDNCNHTGPHRYPPKDGTNTWTAPTPREVPDFERDVIDLLGRLDALYAYLAEHHVSGGAGARIESVMYARDNVRNSHAALTRREPLDVPSVNELRHAMQMALPGYQWSDVHLERIIADLRRAARARLTRREPLDVERLARAMCAGLHAHWGPAQITEGHMLGHESDAHTVAAEYARLEAADAP